MKGEAGHHCKEVNSPMVYHAVEVGSSLNIKNIVALLIDRDEASRKVLENRILKNSITGYL